MNSAAELLENRTLDGGWFVKKKIQGNQGNSQITGGNFSVGYEVERGEEVAFLKALDFSKVFANHSGNLVAHLETMASEFNFEKSVLETCRESNIKKVVKLLGDGTEEIEGSESPGKTSYLIFEWAKSDVRKETVNSSIVDHFLALRYMHGITSGLYQLHQKKIIHQDIKPSNVLVFGERGDVKIGDFGRAYSPNHGDMEYNKDKFPGDSTYAPPEIWYEYAEGPDEVIRKRTDVYMLGSMLYFFFTQSPLTAKIIERLPPQFGPSNKIWDKEQIMPYLQHSYGEVIEEFKQTIQENVREEITNILRQLTNLAPEKRGHPSARRSHEDDLSLQRYISTFDRLSHKVLIADRKKK